MAINTSIVLSWAAAYFFTYLIHSTVALVFAWIRVSWAGGDRHVLIERWWKVAATLPLVTAALQVSLGGNERSHFDGSLTSWVSRASAPAGESPAMAHEARRSTPARLVPDRSKAEAAQSMPTSAKGADGDWRWAIESNSSTIDSPQLTPPPDSDVNERLVSRCLAIFRRPWLPQTAAHVIAVIGLCFISFGVARLVVQSFLLRCRLTRLPELRKGRVRHLLDDVLKSAEVRHAICLRQAGESTLPFAHGLFRWTITVPRRIEKKLEADQLKALLAHELAHLVRRDTCWLQAARVLGACFFFQPLNHLARQRWRRAAEYCCDDWAIRQEINPVSLAHCLTSVAEHRMRPWSQHSLGMADDPSLLSNRVEWLLSESRSGGRLPSGATRVLTVAAAIVAGASLIILSPTVTISSTTEKDVLIQDEAADVESEMDLLSDSLAELDEVMLKLETALASMQPFSEKAGVQDPLAAVCNQMRRRQMRIRSRRDQLASRIRGRSPRRQTANLSRSESR